MLNAKGLVHQGKNIAAGNHTRSIEKEAGKEVKMAGKEKRANVKNLVKNIRKVGNRVKSMIVQNLLQNLLLMTVTATMTIVTIYHITKTPTLLNICQSSVVYRRSLQPFWKEGLKVWWRQQETMPSQNSKLRIQSELKCTLTISPL